MALLSYSAHRVSCRGAALILVSMLGVAGTLASAQTFPTKPIRLVVPTAPSGNADIVARIAGAGMSKGLGQPVVIDNQPGGRQIPGALLVAKSVPDGYTLLAIGLAFTVNAGLYNNLPYNSLSDFSPVGFVGSAPLLLIAYTGLPANSMKELIALAKAKPGTVHYASAGLGSPAHLGGELLNTLAGIKLVHVPYKATAQGNTDTMTGVVQLAFPATSSALPLVKSGKLKALGIGGPKRSPLLPDVPAIVETVPGYEVQLWNGMLTKAGTPKSVITRLNTELVKALKTPQTRDKLVAAGLDLRPGTPDEFGRYLEGEIKKWARVVKQAGIKGER